MEDGGPGGSESGHKVPGPRVPSPVPAGAGTPVPLCPPFPETRSGPRLSARRPRIPRRGSEALISNHLQAIRKQRMDEIPLT